MAPYDETKVTASATQGWRETLERIGPQLEAAGREADRRGAFVSENLNRLHELGFFSLAVPAELGGGGMDLAELGEMLRAVARWDGSTALTLAMHTHVVAINAWRFRHDGATQLEPMLRKVASGVRLVSSGGSDWLPGSGKAVKVEGGFRITGVKVFSSGSPAGDLMSTGAIYDDPEQGPIVLHFTAPLKGEGVRGRDNWDTLGMRGTGSQDVELDGVFVADAAVTVRRTPGKWHPFFHLVSMVAFPLIMSVYAGVADSARRDALKLAAKKTDVVSLIAIGAMENAHTAMDLAIDAMLTLANTSKASPEITNRVMTLRTLVGKGALDVGEKAMEVASGAGFYRAAGLEQRFRDLQAARYHPLQERPQQILAGRTALGLDIDG